MLYLLTIICCIFCVIAIILYICNTNKKTKIEKLNKELTSINSQNTFFIKENARLGDQITMYEKRTFEELKKKPLKIFDEQKNYNGLFYGKKAIIANYDKFSARQTQKMLMIFGLSVDIVSSGIDLYEKIVNGYKYDIIFTNNIFKSGYDGPQLLKKLKDLDHFHTPVIIHTVSEKKDYFINTIGFDEYIKKPINFKELERILNKFL